MKKTFLLTLLLGAFFFANAQTGNKVVIGTIDSINSKMLNEQRKVWVYVPGDGLNNIYSKKRYPVVYLLDGDAHFFSVVGMIQQLSSVNGNTICPEMIVIGIPNTDRTRDLTPSNDANAPYMDSASAASSGGGEKFFSFIEKELIPHIDSVYPTAPYRMLIGHSLGGLTVINALVHHAGVFNSYISIDPSIWWDNKKLLNETKTALTTKKFAGSTLFLGIANTMNDGMDTLRVKKDTTMSTRHIRSILELNDCLSMDKKSGLSFKSKYYHDDDHGSVPLISEYDALHFIFDFYRLKLTEDDYNKPSKELIAKFENYYKEVSKKMGYKIEIPEDMINGMGYQKLGEKKYDDAEYLFKLNVANYPQSFNVYDSLGDLYVAKGDNANAITNFKKALTLNEFPETRKKLEKLEGKK